MKTKEQIEERLDQLREFILKCSIDSLFSDAYTLKIETLKWVLEDEIKTSHN